MSGFDVEIDELSSKILQDKLTKMTERNDQRKAVENRRRKDRFKFGSHAEQTEVFSETFKEHQRKIEQELTAASEAGMSGETRTGLTIRLDNIFKIIDDLKRYLTESSMFLKAFDNEQAKIEFQEIMNKFNQMRNLLLPTKKFGFNSKPKPAIPVTVANPDKLSDKPQTKVNSKMDVCNFGFFQQSDQTLRLIDDDVHSKDITLRNLINCQVYLLGCPGSIYIHKLSNCTVVCGPTYRSVYIEECSNCQFYFACQQGRIHRALECDFYIHVTSRAIIEDCHNVRFAPYLLKYMNLEKDFQQSMLNININNWDKVEDFKHLAVDVPSPNWTIIDESDRKVLNLD